MASVQRASLEMNVKIAPLEAKLIALEHKKEMVDTQGGATGGGAAQRIVVSIPAGSYPGSTFNAYGPNGEVIPCTVPAGSQPGDTIEVVVPS